MTTGAGGQAGVSSAVVDAGSGPDADGRLECNRVVASTSCVGCNVTGRLGKGESFHFVLTGVFGLVDLMPDLDAVMCPSAVAGLWCWFWLRIFAVREG